jgi:hypothetical protein
MFRLLMESSDFGALSLEEREIKGKFHNSRLIFCATTAQRPQQEKCGF